MLSRFDWLRRSRTGSELLATLRYFESHPEPPSPAPEGDAPVGGGKLGPPHSALHGPCQRCWVYPRGGTRPQARYCPTCQAIVAEARKLKRLSREAVVIWGFVNRLPRQLRPAYSQASSAQGSQESMPAFVHSPTPSAYIHDEHHFLLVLPQRELKSWLQNIVLYHGTDLKGFLQIMPTTGVRDPTMGDLLVRIAHHDARFPMDRLRLRFFAKIQQIFNPRLYEREGVLTFEVSEFLNMLELAAVFRTVLRPEEQKALYRILHIAHTSEAQFYWGRFLGTLNQEARDMLNAWRIRQWSEHQLTLLYELVTYVAFYQSR